MKFDAFIGGSYQSQAVTADQERSINWYPEQLQVPGATSKLVLYPTPGVQIIGSHTGPGYGRAHYSLGDIELACIGTTVYSVQAGGFMNVAIGFVQSDSNPATICGNGDDQFLVTSGGNAYLTVLTAGAWASTQIVALNGKATQGAYLDGRFIVFDAAAGQIYISAVFDGLTWAPGSDFAARTLAPDPWRAMKVVGRYIWLFGEQTTEIWQDTGATFPFAPFPQSLLPYGIAAPYSAALVGNGVCWLANNSAGRRCVMYASGQTPEVISTYPIESALSSYADISTAVGDSYSEKGHSFYLLNIEEQPETTFVWDLETKLWHERGTWRSEQNNFEAWRPRFHAFAFGEHRTLDSAGPYIYRMSTELFRDVDGLQIRRVRRAPALQAENKRIFYSSFEVDVEPGHGLTRNGVETQPTMASFEMTWTTGRLLAIDDADWASNVNNGYDSFQAYHDILLDDIVYLLTGKRTGANILIVAQFTTGIWGSQFTAGLSRLGHTFTQTMTASTLGAYVMGNFDMTIMLNLSGGDLALIDPYLDANGAILTALVNLNNANWTRYGFASSATTFQSLAGLTFPYNRPMTCPVLGRSPYNKFIFTSTTYISTTKTIAAGTTTLFANDLGQNMAALWQK